MGLILVCCGHRCLSQKVGIVLISEARGVASDLNVVLRPECCHFQYTVVSVELYSPLHMLTQDTWEYVVSFLLIQFTAIQK